MMKKQVVGIVLFLLVVGGAECRRHIVTTVDMERCSLYSGTPLWTPAGNLAPTSEKSKASRQWFYPYGRSDSAHHNNPTGRVSDGLVQSDFLGTYVRT
jgi:hypothetical protein